MELMFVAYTVTQSHVYLRSLGPLPDFRPNTESRVPNVG